MRDFPFKNFEFSQILINFAAELDNEQLTVNN